MSSPNTTEQERQNQGQNQGQNANQAAGQLDVVNAAQDPCAK